MFIEVASFLETSPALKDSWLSAWSLVPLMSLWRWKRAIEKLQILASSLKVKICFITETTGVFQLLVSVLVKRLIQFIQHHFSTNPQKASEKSMVPFFSVVIEVLRWKRNVSRATSLITRPCSVVKVSRPMMIDNVKSRN